MNRILSIFILFLVSMLSASATVYTDYDFEKNGLYYYITDPDKREAAVVQCFGESGYSGAITIPATVRSPFGYEYTVTMVADRAFYGYGWKATDGEGAEHSFPASNVSSVTIGRNVETIGVSAFEYSQLSAVTFAANSGLERIEHGAFLGCQNLSAISLPESLNYVSTQVFEGTGITSVHIPAGLASLSYSSFGYNLTHITVDGANQTYDSREDCNAVIRKSDNTLVLGSQSTVIPAGVGCIGLQAFLSCSGLTSIAIPSSVTRLESGAFAHCSGLTSITIPSSVTSIGEGVFDGCTGLASISVAASSAHFSGAGNAIVRKSDNALIQGCSATIIPSGVKSIASHAFDACTFESIVIPSSVTSIGFWAFNQCYQLKRVNIPASVTNLGQYSFVNVADDLEFTFAALPATIAENAIGNKSCPIVVSEDKREAFRAAFPENPITTLPWISDNVAHGSTSSRTWTQPMRKGDTVSIPYHVSSEAQCDDIVFRVNGVEKAKASGEQIGTFIYTATANTPVEIQIEYRKDNSVSHGMDMAWIDSYNYAPNTHFTPGDINDDGRVNVQDYVGVGKYILNGDFDGFNFRAADLHVTDDINVQDYVVVANMILADDRDDSETAASVNVGQYRLRNTSAYGAENLYESDGLLYSSTDNDGDIWEIEDYSDGYSIRNTATGNYILGTTGGDSGFGLEQMTTATYPSVMYISYWNGTDNRYIIQDPNMRFTDYTMNAAGWGLPVGTYASMTDATSAWEFIPVDASSSVRRVADTTDTSADCLDGELNSDGTLTIGLANAGRYAMFQLDLTLPSGATIVSVEGTERLLGHSVRFAQQPDGKWRILADNAALSTLLGESGALLQIHMAGLSSGSMVDVDHALFVAPTGQAREMEPLSVSAPVITNLRDAVSDGASSDLYSLDGKRLDAVGSPMPGVYVVNGKKVVVK